MLSTSPPTETNRFISRRSNPYDGIVLDIMLPNRDGWTILLHLRRRGVNVPVLCLTARDSVEDRVRGLDLGADDYMVKPFEWEEFLARVRANDSPRPWRQISVAHGWRSANRHRRKTAHRGGREISLTEREYTLLEYLALRQGQVVSRTEIWDHLWDQYDETASNVVDVYIGYLRRQNRSGSRAKTDFYAARAWIHD